MSGVHLFIFCKKEYKELFLKHCIYSIDSFILDNILSKNIVSDQKFDQENFNVITDEELWKIIDPNFEFQKLFDDMWTRQQILKLSVNNLVQGDILVVDADLLFLQPIKLVEDNRYNFYTAREYDPAYFQTISLLIGIEKQIKESFITDFAIFNSDILSSLMADIEKQHKKNWLLVLSEMLPNSNKARTTKKGMLLSEYELYGTYVQKHFLNHVNSIKKSNRYCQTWIGIDKKKLSKSGSKKLIEEIENRTNNYFQSIKIIDAKKSRIIRKIKPK